MKSNGWNEVHTHKKSKRKYYYGMDKYYGGFVNGVKAITSRNDDDFNEAFTVGYALITERRV